MFVSGDITDMRIVTASQTLNVHKSVLSAASEELRNIVGDADESGTQVLPETNAIVTDIIKHCYGIDLELESRLEDNEDACIEVLDLYVAADKVRDMLSFAIPYSANTVTVRPGHLETID